MSNKKPRPGSFKRKRSLSGAASGEILTNGTTSPKPTPSVRSKNVTVKNLLNIGGLAPTPSDN